MWDHAECRDPSSTPGAIHGQAQRAAIEDDDQFIRWLRIHSRPSNDRLQPSAAGAILIRRG